MKRSAERQNNTIEIFILLWYNEFTKSCKKTWYVDNYCTSVRNFCGTNFNLAKIGIEGVNSKLTTAIKTTVAQMSQAERKEWL